MNTKATVLSLNSFSTPQMKAFHITWMTFFLCFFGWFGIAPLMPVIREELQLTKDQVGNIMIASVSVTIFARLLIGWVCDRIGPRLTYSALLAVGSIPVMLIGLSKSYESFLLFRLAIGVIGASFVITQYHTSVMFAPNVVGRANATAAGWGNLGAFGSHALMPLLFSAFVGLGFDKSDAWRQAMIVPGILLMCMSIVYYKFTQDTPEGNVLELRKNNPEYRAKNPDVKGSFKIAMKDYRTWILFLMYGCCFGIEIMFDNVLTIYFTDEFQLGLKEVGFIVACFALMNIFARALGGIFADKAGASFGTYGKAVLLGAFLLLEGIGIIFFSQATTLTLSIVALISLAFFIKMSNGVTYSIVPFVNKDALGSISGIVGAGGNLGAVLATSLFKSMDHREGFLIIGITIAATSFLAYTMKFSNQTVTPKKEIKETELESV
jgi:MFS transporter, NNP family, nitrate/nitrite transporter